QVALLYRPVGPGSGRCSGHLPSHRRSLLGLCQGLAVLRHLRRRKTRNLLISLVRVRRAGAVFRTVLWPRIQGRSPVMVPKSIHRIYWDAVQLASAAERNAYLDRVCAGERELRRRVEQLFQARSKAEGFLESPPPAPVATVDERPLSEGPGTVIGPYQ